MDKFILSSRFMIGTISVGGLVLVRGVGNGIEGGVPDIFRGVWVFSWLSASGSMFASVDAWCLYCEGA